MNNNRHEHSVLPVDSRNYDVITRAMNAIPPNKTGMTCEIGVREGGGTGFIIDSLSKGKFPFKVHIGVDPYGNLIYPRKEGVNKRANYTNSMRDKSIGRIYNYAMKKGVNFIFINLEDSEFFRRFGDGIPVYNSDKRILTEYIFVHIDGPHQYKYVYDEFCWFNERMTSGATIAFDNIKYYDHESIEKHIFNCGWKLIERFISGADTFHKASYQKT